MRAASLLASLVVLAPAGRANDFGISGAGGAIPDPPANGTWNVRPTWTTLRSSVNVPYAVTRVTAIELLGLVHPRRGDLHVYLTDPTGARTNVIVRPGFQDVPGNPGDTGDYLSGAHPFRILTNGTASAAVLDQGAANLAPGEYQQYFNAGAGAWTSSTYAIQDTRLSAISGPAGTWTLTIADWAVGQTGSIERWTLEGEDVSGIEGYCDPGANGVTACPCSNPPSEPGRGCNNFGAHTGGASLSATGLASLASDTLVLTATGENNTALTIFLQGTSSNPTGVLYGAGVRCVAGSLRRLYSGNASAGAISRPRPTDPSVHARSAALGNPIAAGQWRYYLAFYRDPQAVGPCGNTGAAFNCTPSGSVSWIP